MTTTPLRAIGVALFSFALAIFATGSPAAGTELVDGIDVDVSDGHLTIRGTAGPDAVVVEGQGDGTFVINGVLLDEVVTGSIIVSLSSGDDSFYLLGSPFDQPLLPLENLEVNGGSGRSDVAVVGFAVSGTVRVRTGARSDQVLFENVEVGQDVFISTRRSEGRDYDEIVLKEAEVTGKVFMKQKGGDALMTFEGSAGRLEMFGGADDDVLTVIDADVGSALLDGADGDDELWLRGLEQGRYVAKGGNGADSLVASGVSLEAKLKLLGNDGNDVVSVNRRAAPGDIFRGGPGVDAVQACIPTDDGIFSSFEFTYNSSGHCR